MSRAATVVLGQIVVVARASGLQTVEAIGIADGRVVSNGTRVEVLEAARQGARVIDAGDRAVIPGLNDFHLHLVGMARNRREVQLDGASTADQLVRAVGEAAARLAPDAWLLGRGWHDPLLTAGACRRLDATVGGRPAFLMSHDGHSAWASSAALLRAGLADDAADPAGGRLERADGRLTGVLRETAIGPVADMAALLGGDALTEALRETLAELASAGVTGATDAGDAELGGGTGRYAEFGDSFSNLAGRAAFVAERLRLRVDLPADGIDLAAERGLRSGAELDGLRLGWAKVYSDGALGSRTAALFSPYTCPEAVGEGIMRMSAEALDDVMHRAHRTGIGLAIHAIGDRAVASVLDAYQRSPGKQAGAPPDRLEHAQLTRPADRSRFATLDVTASMQPLHCPSDAATIDACWGGREGDAYAWRALADAGARLAFGSDAPIEPADPWLGMFAALHRRYPDAEAQWHPEQAVTLPEALAAYTRGPAVAAGAPDEGHLLPGARADLAVLDVDLDTLQRGDESLAAVRSDLTLLGGRELSRA